MFNKVRYLKYELIYNIVNNVIYEHNMNKKSEYSDYLSIRPIELEILNQNLYSFSINKNVFNHTYKSLFQKLLEMAKNNFWFRVYFYYNDVCFFNLRDVKSSLNESICIEIFYGDTSLDYIIYNKKKECIDHIENILKTFNDFNKLKVIKFNKCNKKIVLLKEQAAATLSHEILGHIFEIDNYNLFKYYNYLNNISRLNLTIKDMPNIKGSFGYYKYDDMGIKSQDIIIFDKGKFTGDIIGGKSNQTNVTNALRRQSLQFRCLPRMSNLFVNTENNYFSQKSFIEITKFNKCYIHHKKGIVELNVSLAVLKEDGQIASILTPFKLNIPIKNIYDIIVGENNPKAQLRPLLCQKQNQIVNCSTLSCDWILKTNELEVIDYE